jgi:hypothetical protein
VHHRLRPDGGTAEKPVSLVYIGLAAAPVAMAITGVLAWPRLLALDHARMMFPWRFWVALVLAGLALVLPAWVVVALL